MLTQPGHENKAYDITGPELLSFPKAVEMASALAGKPIHTSRSRDDEMFAYFDSLGIPRHASDDPTTGPFPGRSTTWSPSASPSARAIST